MKKGGSGGVCQREDEATVQSVQSEPLSHRGLDWIPNNDDDDDHHDYHDDDGDYYHNDDCHDYHDDVYNDYHDHDDEALAKCPFFGFGTNPGHLHHHQIHRHKVRHVGDLGNIDVDEEGVADIKIDDHMAKMR